MVVDQSLVVKIITPNLAAISIATVEILPVVGHVAHETVFFADPGNIKLVEEVAIEVVLVEHVKYGRRLAPSRGVDVLAIVDNAVLATRGTSK